MISWRPRNSTKDSDPLLANLSVVRDPKVSAAEVGEVDLDQDVVDADLGGALYRLGVAERPVLLRRRHSPGSGRRRRR